MIAIVAMLSSSIRVCNYHFFSVVGIIRFNLLASLIIIIRFVYKSGFGFFFVFCFFLVDF